MSYLVVGLSVLEDEIMEGVVHFSNKSFYWWTKTSGPQTQVPNNYRVI